MHRTLAILPLFVYGLVRDLVHARLLVPDDVVTSD